VRQPAALPLWDGPIECRPVRLDMVAGVLRERAAPPPA